MKAELRIGNLVRFAEDATIFEVVEIMAHGLTVKNEDEQTWIELEAFEPIPLTEEWILRLGFEWYEPLKHYRLVKDEIWASLKVRTDNYYFSIVNLAYDESAELYPIKREYVHQLQNLFYALTGKELTLKTTK